MYTNGIIIYPVALYGNIQMGYPVRLALIDETYTVMCLMCL
jgi:hypothetical protein